MVVEKVINNCLYRCPFVISNSDGMACGHPYWTDKGYDNMIITHENASDKIPEKCPLRIEPLTLQYVMEEK